MMQSINSLVGAAICRPYVTILQDEFRTPEDGCPYANLKILRRGR